MRTLSFQGGDTMPALGLGTWQSRPDAVYEAVKEALRIGYRHIDCAFIYGNETEVGRALEESFAAGVCRREELWITSKLWNNAHHPEHVRPALQNTLAALRLDYLDLYLMHWPVALRAEVSLPAQPEDYIPLEELPVATTWAAMEPLVEAGLCRHIGVSNFSVKKLAGLLEVAERKPEVNQVELHPYLPQNPLVDFCAAQGVHITAYSPLGSPGRPAGLKAADEPRLLEDAVVASVAARREVSPAQVLIAWSLHRGLSVIPKSVNPGRIAQNLAAAEVELDAADLAALAGLDRGRRYVTGVFWTTPGSPYTLENLWDE